MAGNQVTLTFAGDAAKAQQAIGAVTASGDRMAADAKSWSRQLETVTAATDGLGSMLGDVGGAMTAWADAAELDERRSIDLAQAVTDVEQAQEDMRQAVRDASQAIIDQDSAALDLSEAQLDAADALDEYNKAVKEHGANSREAQRAQIDLQRAQLAVRQAEEDGAQATRNLNQAQIDAKQGTVDLRDAQLRAKQGGDWVREWGERLNTISPILMVLASATGIVTAAQWAWNLAQMASPTTWIVLAIVALVAIFVALWVKCDAFREFWIGLWDVLTNAISAAIDWIKENWQLVLGFVTGPIGAAVMWVIEHWSQIKQATSELIGSIGDWFKELPGRIGSALSGLASAVTWPFRTAFNLISDIWNRTVGSLSWTVPGWIPGIGGNTISVPRLPRFHDGGRVPGAPGSELLALLQAGETVLPAGTTGGIVIEIKADGSRASELLLYLLRDAIEVRGGTATVVEATV